MMIDESILTSLLELNNADLTERIMSLEEENIKTLDIDKIWDALHCFLTNESASNPIEGNKLSEAIIGVHNFNYEEDADFITCTDHNELREIIEAMEGVDVNERKIQFNWELMEANNIYPNGIWEKPREELFTELTTSYFELLKFYKSALEKEKHVVVSVL